MGQDTSGRVTIASALEHTDPDARVFIAHRLRPHEGEVVAEGTVRELMASRLLEVCGENVVERLSLELDDMDEREAAAPVLCITIGDKPENGRRKTVFDKITATPAALSDMLASLSVPDSPWDRAFHLEFCARCTREDCDPCPHEAARHNPAWWLRQEARS